MVVKMQLQNIMHFLKLPRAGARTLIWGGGVYSYIRGYARLISFEINFITKETCQAEPECMNIHPPPLISVLEPALKLPSMLLN